ncbi:MAG: putative D-isomer specific 2-hydroxyacid dehydrogenase NAD-binding [Bryobacterales bacterium]|nr:putative D-isomer specific 2-hydroxyacid dehydrogenase NAD-binding [Bryobacterales bacterium]
MHIPQRPSILVSESGGFSPEAKQELEKLGAVVWADLDRSRLLKAVCDADVLWVRLKHVVDAELLAAGRRLKIIVTPTTGLTHIDTTGAAALGIELLSLRDACPAFLSSVRATAEHTIALMLALLRRLPAASEHVRRGGWERDLFRGCELYGKIVGIVGYGRLGRIVARYIAAFECTVLAADPYVDPRTMEPPLRLVPLLDLLDASDLVSIHVNLTEKTFRFFGTEEFCRMKRGSWFINTARGELVDEAALLEALESGLLRGAALDVISAEQKGEVQTNPLIAYSAAHDHLLITPHIGGCTGESMGKTELHMVERLRDALTRTGVEVMECR